MSRNCQYRNEASFPAVSIQNKQDFKKKTSAGTNKLTDSCQMVSEF